MSDWSVADVMIWLQKEFEMRKEETQAFEDNKIDGCTLMALTHEEKDELLGKCGTRTRRRFEMKLVKINYIHVKKSLMREKQLEQRRKESERVIQLHSLSSWFSFDNFMNIFDGNNPERTKLIKR